MGVRLKVKKCARQKGKTTNRGYLRKGKRTKMWYELKYGGKRVGNGTNIPLGGKVKEIRSIKDGWEQGKNWGRGKANLWKLWGWDQQETQNRPRLKKKVNRAEERKGSHRKTIGYTKSGVRKHGSSTNGAGIKGLGSTFSGNTLVAP